MKLTLAEPRLLKESIGIISDLVNEVSIKVDSNKIQIIAMDPANVAMTVFKLLSSAFIEYSIDTETTLSLSLESLKQVLRRAKPTDSLSLELEENRLKISLIGDSVRTFKISLLDLEERDQKIPQLSFSLNVKTSSHILSEAVEDVSIIAESVLFEVEPGKMTVASEGNLNDAKVEIRADEVTEIKTESSRVKSKYSIEYLKKIIAGSRLADEVTIEFAKDYPLKITYFILNKLELTFILAPRVENI